MTINPTRDEAISILEAARLLISDPKRWTKGVSARDAAGVECDPISPDAYCWCANGAIALAGYPGAQGSTDLQLRERRFLVHDALYRQVVKRGALATSLFNDCAWTSHQDILDCFDGAIDDLKGRG